MLKHLRLYTKPRPTSVVESTASGSVLGFTNDERSVVAAASSLNEQHDYAAGGHDVEVRLNECYCSQVCKHVCVCL